MNIKLLPLFLLCTGLGYSHPAAAHPHAWISVKTTIFVNDRGDATAIREHWLFDKMYSTYAAQDFNPNKNGKFTEKDLLPIANENLSNLKDYNYFTVFERNDGKAIRFKGVKDIASSFELAPEGEKEKVVIFALPRGVRPSNNKKIADTQQIAMDFTVEFTEAVNLREHSATYRIYDPTYYTDITHDQRHAVTFLSEKDGKIVTGCQAKVELPKVDQSMIFKATALDWNKSAPEDFGYSFSEKVTLSCSQLKP